MTTSTTTTLDPNRREWKGFLKSMRANRGEDTVRLAFSDWLEETFGPNAFASFIREQIDFCRRHDCLFSPVISGFVSRVGVTRVTKVMSPDWYREREIGSLFSRCWGPRNWNVMAGLGDRDRAMWFFERGFPSAVVCPFDWWEKHARKICAIGPVGTLILTEYPRVYREDRIDGTIAYWFGGKSILLDADPNDATRHAAIENLLKMVWKPGEEVESLRIILP